MYLTAEYKKYLQADRHQKYQFADGNVQTGDSVTFEDGETIERCRFRPHYELIAGVETTKILWYELYVFFMKTTYTIEF